MSWGLQFERAVGVLNWKQESITHIYGCWNNDGDLGKDIPILKMRIQ